LAGKLGAEIQGTEAELAASISEVINSSSNMVEDEPQQSSSVLNTTSRVQQMASFAGKTKAELTVIAKALGLRTGNKNKDDILHDIIECQQISKEKITQFRASLKSSSASRTPPHHSKYREAFNGIDLHDRKWNDLQNHHTVKDWRAKFVFSLLQSGIVNAWVVQRHFEEITFSKYLDELGGQLSS